MISEEEIRIILNLPKPELLKRNENDEFLIAKYKVWGELVQHVLDNPDLYREKIKDNIERIKTCQERITTRLLVLNDMV